MRLRGWLRLIALVFTFGFTLQALWAGALFAGATQSAGFVWGKMTPEVVAEERLCTPLGVMHCAQLVPTMVYLKANTRVEAQYNVDARHGGLSLFVEPVGQKPANWVLPRDLQMRIGGAGRKGKHTFRVPQTGLYKLKTKAYTRSTRSSDPVSFQIGWRVTQ